MQLSATSDLQTIVIKGDPYVGSSEVARAIGVSRQTLWRWRQAGRVPAGRIFRGRHVVFTLPEVEVIRAYATRLEPASSTPVTANGMPQQ